MQRRDWAQPRIAGRREHTTGRLGPGPEHLDAARLLGIGQDGTIGHEMLRVVSPLPRVEDRFHSSPLRAAQPASSSIRLLWPPAETNPR